MGIKYELYNYIKINTVKAEKQFEISYWQGICILMSQHIYIFDCIHIFLLFT